jgi:PAS domain-containing protein
MDMSNDDFNRDDERTRVVESNPAQTQELGKDEIEGLRDMLRQTDAAGLSEGTSPGVQDAIEEFVSGETSTPERLQELVLGLMRENHDLDRTSSMERRIAVAVLRDSPSGISIYDKAGRMVASNPRNVEITGIPADGSAPVEQYTEMYGTHMRLDGTTYSEGEFPVARSLLHGERVKGEYMIAVYPATHPQGCVIRVSSSPIRDKRGKIVAALAFATLVASGSYPVGSEDEGGITPGAIFKNSAGIYRKKG